MLSTLSWPTNETPNGTSSCLILVTSLAWQRPEFSRRHASCNLATNNSKDWLAQHLVSFLMLDLSLTTLMHIIVCFNVVKVSITNKKNIFMWTGSHNKQRSEYKTHDKNHLLSLYRAVTVQELSVMHHKGYTLWCR